MSIPREDRLTQLSVLEVSNETVTLLLDEFEEMARELAHWRALAAQLAEEKEIASQQARDAQERAHRLEEHVDILRDRLQRIDEIMRIETKNMGPSEKLAFIKIDRLTGGTVDNQGSKFIGISVADIGKSIGMSGQTAGDNIIKLAARGYIAREQEKEKLGKGQFKTHVQVARTLYTDTPELLEVEKDKQGNQGGKRVTCEKCGGENVDVYQALECRDCGHISPAKLVKKQKGFRGKLSKVSLTPISNDDTTSNDENTTTPF